MLILQFEILEENLNANYKKVNKEGIITQF